LKPEKRKPRTLLT